MTLQAAASTAYDASQFDDNFPAGIEDHFWFKARNRRLDAALRQAQRSGLLPEHPRILEVGCGTGIVVDDLRRRGHDIFGVEIGRPATYAGSQDRIVAGMRAEALPAEFRNQVDALMFLDVIEHIPDDTAMLRETLSAFPRCRAVVVTVPARPEVWSAHDDHYGHFRRYTRPSLRAALVEAGLVPEVTRYMFRSLYLMAGLMTLTGRGRDPVLKAPARKAVHAWLASVLDLEDRVIGALPLPGLSLVAVASVPGLGTGIRP